MASLVPFRAAQQSFVEAAAVVEAGPRHPRAVMAAAERAPVIPQLLRVGPRTPEAAAVVVVPDRRAEPVAKASSLFGTQSRENLWPTLHKLTRTAPSCK